MQQLKAEVPRPTLMASSYQECCELYNQIKCVYSQYSKLETNLGDTLIFKCRAIRGYLTRERIVNEFAINVYELSIDVCLQLEEWADSFSCIVQLTKIFYPLLQQKQLSISQLKQQFDSLHMGESDQSDCEMEFDLILPRRDEIQSLLILYYIGVPNKLDLLELRQCFLLLQDNNSQGKYCEWAFSIMHFVLRDDYVGYFGILSKGTQNQQQILNNRSQKMRQKAMGMICQTYRRVKMQYVLNILQIESSEDVRKLLIELHEQGFQTASNALQALDLQFAQLDLARLSFEKCVSDVQVADSLQLIFKQ
eukprot:TRINITY_DN7688_c0_g1_i1.p1 TRINITY_DN7688_c0_g1~~TRINITY_DN7688_c0_g1_i1.p1  ORF type:complete len:308 (-),score=19.20 TRINITY_DN7688_c0_g1_i1:171-1094(-)